MLREFIASCLVPASRHARRSGYVYETIAIEARHRRCGAAWSPHLASCHDAVLAAAEHCRSRRLAVVLGSGPLLDIPLLRLAEIFAEVVLVDVFHPARARRQAAKIHNLRLLEEDLLGFAGGGGWGQAPSALGRWRDRLPAPDLVVSANLLSQLPLRPLARLGSPGEEAIARVLQAHVEDLAGGPGIGCLISEWRRRRYDRRGNLTSEELPLGRLALPPSFSRWEWLIAPPGELPGGASLVLDVAGYVFLPVHQPP